MSKGGKVFLTVVIIIIVAIGIWYSVNKQPQEQLAIKIGFIGPLAGTDLVSLGQGAKSGLELAIKEINEKGGINGKMVEAVFEDTKCNTEAAATAANKLVNIDRVPVIIGGLCSNETLGAAPTAEQGKTILISYCSSNPGITDAGDYIFRDYPSDNFQGVKAAEVAYNQLEVKKAAILYCLSDWCTGLDGVFKQKFQELGGEIVAEESFEQAATDLRTQLIKIQQAKPEIIYFVSYTQGAIIGLKQIKEMGIEAKILGGDAWDDSNIPKELGETANEAMYILPDMPLSDEFKDRVRQGTGVEEVTVCTATAYDAANVIFKAMEKVGVDPDLIREELYQMSEHQGVSGPIAFDENGDLKRAQYAIKVYQDGEAVLYEAE